MCGDCMDICCLGTFMSCMGCCYRHEGDLEAAPQCSKKARCPMFKKEKSINPKELQRTWKNAIRQVRKTHPARLYPLLTNNTSAFDTPLTASQFAAQQHLRDLFSPDTETFRTYPTILLAAQALDTLLFNSTLHSHIAITIAEFRDKTWLWKERFVKGRCIAPPWPVKRLLKVHIKLNNTLMMYGSRYELLGTLIHEMLHAYFVLAKSGTHGEGHVSTLAVRAVGRIGVKGLEVEHIVG